MSKMLLMPPPWASEKKYDLSETWLKLPLNERNKLFDEYSNKCARHHKADYLRHRLESMAWVRDQRAIVGKLGWDDCLPELDKLNVTLKG